MKFRTAKLDDFYQLANMRWDFKTEDKELDDDTSKEKFIEHCIEFFKKGLENNNWTHWVAIDNENIVSHISIQHIQKIPKPNRFNDEYGYVTNVYTNINYRGQGIGSLLLKQVTSWAIDRDLEILIVWPSKKAVKFYERQGFVSQNDIMELEFRTEEV